MTRPVVLRPEAEADLESTHSFYEERLDGLGDGFLECVSEQLDRIALAPEQFGFVGKNVRFVLLRRFPHVIYYRVHPDRVEILAVLHGRRAASAWRRRTDA
jgi:toxin ParE1/3/4